MHQYKQGLGYQAAYITHGRPYATSSLTVPNSGSAPLEIDFGYVIRFVTVYNNGDQELRVGFSVNGVSGSGTNYFLIPSSGSYTGEWKVSKLYLTTNTGGAGSASVVAGLTSIKDSELDHDSINHWSGSVGVG